ncbi:MAG: Ig-like domain-containing protein [Nitrospinales bacterium]
MSDLKVFRKIGSRSWLAPHAGLLLLLGAVLLAGCDNSSSGGGPLGPSNTATSAALIQVTPSSATVIKGDVITFTAAGGTGTFTWSVSDPTLASIVSTTGVFTAASKTGTVTVTAIDSNGARGTATISIATKTLIIVPANSKVGKGATQAFAVNGATAPVFWSTDNTTIGSIDVNTGLFTAGITAGTVNVTVLDADGDTASASVEVIPNVITVTPASVSFSAVPVPDPVFTAAGGSGSFTFLLSGATNSFAGAAIGTAAGNVTATTALVDVTAMPTGNTLVATVCTAGQGTQTLTITATDSNGDSGTAQLTLIATDACTL